jgi:hypothetical protein
MIYRDIPLIIRNLLCIFAIKNRSINQFKTNDYEKEYFSAIDDSSHDGCYVCNLYSLWR